MTDTPGPVCPVCASGGAAHFAAKNGYSLSRCGACGFVFVDPMPAPEALAEIYCREDGDVCADFYPKAESRARRARRRARRFARYIQGRDVLDIGCGGGFMVEAMDRVGGRAVGLDLSPQSIAYARRHYPGGEFFAERLEDFQHRGRTFGFVHCSEVLEHLPDINSFMAALARTMRPGGYVFITTPDIGHWRVPRDVVSWPLVDPPRHVQYFSYGNIRLLFDRYGLPVRRKLFKLKPGLQVLAQRS